MGGMAVRVDPSRVSPPLLILLLPLSTLAWSTPMPPPVLSLANHSIVDALAQLEQAGGGTLYIPSGVWSSPPLNLTSHLTVYLAANATLQADPSVDWPLVAPLPNYGTGHDHPGPRWAPFLGGYGITGLIIGGENGTVDGAGGFWWDRKPTERYTRPSLFECVRCTDVVLEDTTFRNSGFWVLHPVLSRRVRASRITVLNPHDSPNTDGFDPDSTSDVLLEDSFFATGDDMVAIKAGWDCAGYGPQGAPSNNITIRNVTQWRGGGGISLGSEMSGGLSNIRVEDVRLMHGSYGIQVKTGLTRGGFVENVTINNVHLEGTTKNAIRVDAFYSMPNPICTPVRKPPTIHKLSISNVFSANANLSLHLAGALDVPTTGVHLSNITFTCNAPKCSAANLTAECYGGVTGTATGVRPYMPPPQCGLRAI